MDLHDLEQMIPAAIYRYLSREERDALLSQDASWVQAKILQFLQRGCSFGLQFGEFDFDQPSPFPYDDVEPIMPTQLSFSQSPRTGFWQFDPSCIKLVQAPEQTFLHYTDAETLAKLMKKRDDDFAINASVASSSANRLAHDECSVGILKGTIGHEPTSLENVVTSLSGCCFVPAHVAWFLHHHPDQMLQEWREQQDGWIDKQIWFLGSVFAPEGVSVQQIDTRSHQRIVYLCNGQMRMKYMCYVEFEEYDYFAVFDEK